MVASIGGEKGVRVRRDGAVKLVDVLAGESPARADCPVGTVVISGGGAGDQAVGSPDVNALEGRTQVWSAPTGEGCQGRRVSGTLFGGLSGRAVQGGEWCQEPFWGRMVSGTILLSREKW